MIVPSYTGFTPTKAELDFAPCKYFQFHSHHSKNLQTSYIRILNEMLPRWVFDKVFAFAHFHSISWLLATVPTFSHLISHTDSIFLSQNSVELLAHLK